MEVKKIRKIGGFLSIELLLVMTITAIFGGISLYVGKRVIDKAKMVANEAEAQVFIAVLLEYHDLTGKWPIAAENFVSVRTVALELNKAFDKVLWDNPYSLRKENPREFPDIWVRINTRVKLNRYGEDSLTELRRRAGRSVSESEMRIFESVQYFFPKKGDKPWKQSAEEDINRQHPGSEAVMGD